MTMVGLNGEGRRPFWLLQSSGNCVFGAAAAYSAPPANQVDWVNSFSTG